ncbi:MAG: DUF5320 domain-containing protein [Spirochaetales bacterium]|nr:DUF5320 domain-containing protein [Spirochaetales bacterium]
MPRGDRTGPDGFGPMTGRSAGYCAGYSAPGFMNNGGGRRGGAFGGRGRGFRNRYYAHGMYGLGTRGSRKYDDGFYARRISAEEELELSRNQVVAMEEELSALKTYISSIEQGMSKEGEKK